MLISVSVMDNQIPGDQRKRHGQMPGLSWLHPGLQPQGLQVSVCDAGGGNVGSTLMSRPRELGPEWGALGAVSRVQVAKINRDSLSTLLGERRPPALRCGLVRPPEG